MKERNLAGEFCVIDGEFSDLRCLMNTLIMHGNIYTVYGCGKLIPRSSQQ